MWWITCVVQTGQEPKSHKNVWMFSWISVGNYISVCFFKANNCKLKIELEWCFIEWTIKVNETVFILNVYEPSMLNVIKHCTNKYFTSIFVISTKPMH